jgi:hypothetical protein
MGERYVAPFFPIDLQLVLRIGNLLCKFAPNECELSNKIVTKVCVILSGMRENGCFEIFFWILIFPSCFLAWEDHQFPMMMLYPMTLPMCSSSCLQ